MLETRRCPTGKWVVVSEGGGGKAAAAATLSYYTFFVVKQINSKFFSGK